MRRETLSAIRFGYGLGPAVTPSADPKTLIANVQETTRRRPRIGLANRAAVLLNYRDTRKSDDESVKKAAQRKLLRQSADDLRHMLVEAVTGAGFGERLLAFWADHFTVATNGPPLRALVPDFIDAGLRPHLTGRFGELLKSATLHPAMLIYLNQVQSVGPNSRAGQRRDRGLNENLAREVLELHTLGVGANYTQDDVRNFAMLLTGLSVDKGGFKYRQAISEPGPHDVLGKSYGNKVVRLGDITDALEDIALHPDTALHLSRKLQVHFIGAADPDLTSKMADAYLASGGDLAVLYRRMLDDDRAWQPSLTKAKTPSDFIISSLRAAGATAKNINDLRQSELRSGIVEPLQAMGQAPLRPPGPDGWSEDPDDWITPPGLAARIRWAVAFAERIEGEFDPRDFLNHALADAASSNLSFAVNGAESRVEGIALTLISPEFNRR